MTALTDINLPVQTEAGNYFVSNYPPYSQWQAEQLPGFESALRDPDGPQGGLGLYVHLPFCRQRCTYCYFRVHTRQPEAYVNRYLHAVRREAAIYRQRPAVGERPIINAYFGGGTPTLLSMAQLETLLCSLRDTLHWPRGGEVTYECQPGTVTQEKLQLLADLGVTRASIGVQTFNDDVLRQVGRAASVEDCRQTYAMARQVGFEQVNIDLMAGLPGETEASWRKTVEQTARLQPDGVTIYQLERTHNSALNRTLEGGREVPLATWPTKRRWVGEAFDRLQGHGYQIIGAYWAVRDPKKHRYAYVRDHFWQGRDLLALGEASFGHLRGHHYQNVDDYEPYVHAVESDRLPLWRAYRLSHEEALRREAILQLKTGVLRLDYFERKFGIDLREHFMEPLKRLAQMGLVLVDFEAIRLTREGLLKVDWLLPLFYLPQHMGVRYT